MDIINVATLSSIVVPVPSKKEQSEITQFIYNENQTCYTLVSEAQRAIDLLQERRTALISAAVTGKIDVRGLAESGDA